MDIASAATPDIMANSFSRTTRSLASDASGRVLLAWVLLTAATVAWFAWFAFAKVTVYEVSSTARLEVAGAPRAAAALLPGKILSTSVHLKQHVEAGEVLVELDARSQRLALAEEQMRLAAIPPQLTALERQIADEQQAHTNAQSASASALDRARADHREALAAAQFAEEHARRFERMSPSGRVSEIEALRARAEATKTRAAAEALAAEIARLAAEENSKAATRRATLNSLQREAAVLNGQREVSLASAARLRQEIEKHLIRAPSSGEIGAAAPLDVGAFVAAGEVVARIVPSDRLRVVADFAPAHVLGRVSKGQVARMRLDGFPWAQFGTLALTVDRVASEIRDGRIRVELLPEASSRSKLLQHGLPGSVEIEIERTTPLVMVLRAAGQMLASPAQPASPATGSGS